jgi:hypothetical protein
MMSFIEKKKKVWFGKGAVVIEIEPPPPPPPPPTMTCHRPNSLKSTSLKRKNNMSRDGMA